MATNLISTITQVLSPELLGRIAAALGLDKYLVDKAISAGVPALLAAMSSKAATRDGAASLNRAISAQQPDILSSVGSLIGGSGQASLIDAGRNALTSLLGGATTDTLSGAIDKFSGVGAAGSKGLLGMLAPVVMGVLGQQQRTTGMSAADILSSQRANIAKALPAGVAKYLSGTGILDAIPISQVDSPRASSYASQSDKRLWEKPASEGGWILPALAVLALGALAWSFLSGPSNKTTVETTAVPKPVETTAVPKPVEAPLETGALKAPAMPANAFAPLNGVKVGDIDLGAELTSAVNNLRSSLDGIKDEASARSAVPALTDSKEQLDTVTGLINQLSPEMRKTLASAIMAVKPTLDQLLDKAMAIPGVGAVIKPTVDTIRANISTMATA